MPREITINVYRNRKGEHRLAAIMSYNFALRVAVDDLDALDEIRRSIKKRVEREEAPELESRDIIEEGGEA